MKLNTLKVVFNNIRMFIAAALVFPGIPIALLVYLNEPITYLEEMWVVKDVRIVQNTNKNDVVGNVLIGSVLLGTVGALIGASTAETTTVILCSIDVLDTNGGVWRYTTEGKHCLRYKLNEHVLVQVTIKHRTGRYYPHVDNQLLEEVKQ